MRDSEAGLGRRRFLAALAAGCGAPAPAQPRRKRVAVVATTCFPNSHADVIVNRILEGYRPDGVKVEPRTAILSMYVDQAGPRDIAAGMAAKHGFRIWPSVAEALRAGGDRLAADAVLLIGEHGDYPSNARGQKLYPRYELFQQVAAEIERAGRPVPLFSDKHLSYSWEKALAMHRRARELKVPLMAGSSIPVTYREPRLELPAGCRIEQAVSVGYGGLESYGFHALEGLQCMVERRRGGETGIAAVHCLEGEAVWKWRDGEGRWSAPLLAAALGASPTLAAGRMEANVKAPAVFLLEYRDGLRAANYMLEGHSKDFLFAAKLEGKSEPAATRFVLFGSRPLPHFDGLVHSIERFFESGVPVYPVERTLLTTGALAFLFDSRERGARVATPELAIAYRAADRTYFERA